MRKLHIDIESFSATDLKKAGLYRYSADVEILWLSYKYDRAPVRTIDVYHNGVPDRIIADMQDPDIIKISHNAPFEIVNLGIALGIWLDPSQWRCTMGLCAMAGLPLSLDEATRILGVATKDPAGSTYITLFSKPCKPTKANGGRVRNLPEHFPDKWLAYGRYNAKDVVAESDLDNALEIIYVSDFEREVWALDQKINANGIRIDLQLVRNAIEMNINFRERLTKEFLEITGLKPGQLKAVKSWIEEETDSEIENLRKKNIPKLIEQFDSEVVKRVLGIREQLSKTSVAKYSTMMRAVMADGRIRGLFQYCGAGRTWRFAGRLVQLQNLVKGKYKYNKKTGFDDLDFARTLLKNGEVEMLEAMYGPLQDTLSQLVRTAIIPGKGKKFAIMDFASIEARILAWLADETWRLKAFENGEDIYILSAAAVLRKDPSLVTKDERDKIGKVGELASGYAGGVNAWIKFGALEAGLTEQEIQKGVDGWRAASPNIKNFWYAMNQAAIKSINTGRTIKVSEILDRDGYQVVKVDHGVSFSYKDRYLMMNLPSGHSLYYFNASLVPGKYGVQIQYWGFDQTTKRWCRQRTYGGKLTENLCQAIGRDCLVNGMLNLDKAGYEISLHVHDETASEIGIDAGEEVLDEMLGLLCKKAPWMKNLPLKAEGFFAKYYRKD